MEKNYQHYLENGSDAEKEAFVAGALAMAEALHQPCLEQTEITRAEFVFGTLIRHQAEREKLTRENSMFVAARFPHAELLRTMTLDDAEPPLEEDSTPDTEPSPEERSNVPTLVTATNDSDFREHSSNAKPLLTAKISSHITNRAQYNVATVQNLTYGAKPINITQGDSRELDYYAELLECFFDNEQFDKHFPRREIVSYEDDKGNKLPGASIDANGTPIIIDRDAVDKHGVVEKATLRADYIRYILLPRMAQKLAEALSQPLTADDLKNTELSALLRLAETASRVIRLNTENPLGKTISSLRDAIKARETASA